MPLPTTPDELAAALIVTLVLAALAAVAVGRGVLLLLDTVNNIRRGRRSMSSAAAPAAAASAPFRVEPEPEREPEPAAAPAEPPPAPAGKLYTEEQIERLKEEAREAGAARALGLLLGRQIVEEPQRTAAMELLFGKRGRRWQRLGPLIEEARAASSPPAEEARLVPINGGDRGHVEL